MLYNLPEATDEKLQRRPSVRTISLTPSGDCTNFALDYITPDILNGTIDEFDVIDFGGNQIKKVY